MLEDDLAGGQALGPGGADIIGREHLDHAGADQPHEGRRGIVAERHGRHDVVLPGRGAGDRPSRRARPTQRRRPRQPRRPQPRRNGR